MTSESNVLYFRFYAEKNGINSTFAAVTTSVRDTSNTGGTCEAVIIGRDILIRMGIYQIVIKF